MTSVASGIEHHLVRERVDPDGALRRALSGALDLSVGPVLADRLAHAATGQGICGAGRAVVVSRRQPRLSSLDGSGTRGLIVAASEGRDDGGRPEIDR
jgi:hypothetical protein